MLLFFQVAISLSLSISIHGKISDFIGGLFFMLLFLHVAISQSPSKEISVILLGGMLHVKILSY